MQALMRRGLNLSYILPLCAGTPLAKKLCKFALEAEMLRGLTHTVVAFACRHSLSHEAGQVPGAGPDAGLCTLLSHVSDGCCPEPAVPEAGHRAWSGHSWAVGHLVQGSCGASAGWPFSDTIPHVQGERRISCWTYGSSNGPVCAFGSSSELAVPEAQGWLPFGPWVN